jgi:ubiquinone/menaquinone biosynthesis C-methylase UbiE
METIEFYKKEKSKYSQNDKFPEIIDINKDLFKLKSNKNLLDLGCGDGAFLILLEDLTNLELYGVDISEHAIKEFEKKIRNNGLNINIEHSNLNKLPFPDNYFDVITCHEVLEHIVDISPALAEMWRVAKNNAKFLVTIPHGYSLHVLKVLFSDQFKEIFSFVANGYLDDKKWKGGRIPFHRYYKPKEIKRRMIANGLIVDDIKGHTYLSLLHNSFKRKIHVFLNNLNNKKIINYGSIMIIRGRIEK